MTRSKWCSVVGINQLHQSQLIVARSCARSSVAFTSLVNCVVFVSAVVVAVIAAVVADAAANAVAVFILAGF